MKFLRNNDIKYLNFFFFFFFFFKHISVFYVKKKRYGFMQYSYFAIKSIILSIISSVFNQKSIDIWHKNHRLSFQPKSIDIFVTK